MKKSNNRVLSDENNTGNCAKQRLCDVTCTNCKTKVDELYEHQTVADETKEQWCSDCMRRIDRCLSCDSDISAILLYYSIDEWGESVCPNCSEHIA